MSARSIYSDDEKYVVINIITIATTNDLIQMIALFELISLNKI